jgi:hypothetical protein
LDMPNPCSVPVIDCPVLVLAPAAGAAVPDRQGADVAVPSGDGWREPAARRSITETAMRNAAWLDRHPEGAAMCPGRPIGLPPG